MFGFLKKLSRGFPERLYHFWIGDLDSLHAPPGGGVSLVFILANFIGYSDLSL